MACVCLVVSLQTEQLKELKQEFMKQEEQLKEVKRNSTTLEKKLEYERYFPSVAVVETKKERIYKEPLHLC